MAGWFYALLLGGALVAFNLRRFASWRGALTVAGACAIWSLVAGPALWMWFFDEHTVSHTLGMATFAGGASASSVHTFFVNYAAHFKWSYLVTTGDPKSGITWRYLDGMGAFFGWVVPLAGLGLAASARYIRPRWAMLWTLLWLAAYPLGGALTNQGTPGTPNAPRTLAGAPVFCILAAIGTALLFDWAGFAAVAKDRSPCRHWRPHDLRYGRDLLDCLLRSVLLHRLRPPKFKCVVFGNARPLRGDS